MQTSICSVSRNPFSASVVPVAPWLAAHADVRKSVRVGRAWELLATTLAKVPALPAFTVQGMLELLPLEPPDEPLGGSPTEPLGEPLAEPPTEPLGGSSAERLGEPLAEPLDRSLAESLAQPDRKPAGKVREALTGDDPAADELVEEAADA